MVNVVFMGTPDFAVPSLQALIEHAEFTVVGVVTQPDRPAGRGQQRQPPPVKVCAEQAAIPVFQPETLRDDDAIARLKDWSPDVLVVVAFGQILRQPVLDLAPYGSINVHASLLPRWRGAAPIHYAIRAGDDTTGVTIMKMDAGLDTGPMLDRQVAPIAPDETGQSLHDKLSRLGADMLPGVLLRYIEGKITPQPQPDDGMTYAPMLKKEEGQIDWSRPAAHIDRLVRAFTPWPGTYTFLEGKRLKIITGNPEEKSGGDSIPGTLLKTDKGVGVQTGQGFYRLETIQPSGKRVMNIDSFMAGRPDIIGKVLG